MRPLEAIVPLAAEVGGGHLGSSLAGYWNPRPARGAGL